MPCASAASAGLLTLVSVVSACAATCPEDSSATPMRSESTERVAFAHRVVGGATGPLVPDGVVFGDRWGCASFRSEAGLTWQCWQARVAPAPATSRQGIQAWRVPWLDRKEIIRSHPDRFCTLERALLNVLCWRPPVPGEVSGHELPEEKRQTSDQPDVDWSVLPPTVELDGCVLAEGEVLCRGQGYSASAAAGNRVPIVFEPRPQVAESAVLDRESWEPRDDCVSRRGCTLAPSKIPSCPGHVRARPWSEVLCTSRSGQVVQVRGVLGVSGVFSTMMGCEPGSCCNQTSASVVLVGGHEILMLSGLYCLGDDSRVCCTAPAYGQTVIATGRLDRVTTGLAAGHWLLVEPTLCQPTKPP